MFDPDFIALLEQSVGPEAASGVLSALGEAPSVSIRLNPSRLRECPFPGAAPVSWNPWAYLLKERPVFTLDPLFHAGGYYVQDSSAMFPGALLRRLLPSSEPGGRMLEPGDRMPEPGDRMPEPGVRMLEPGVRMLDAEGRMLEPGVRMLDLCAAPGGKTTDFAASLREAFGERFTLIANEVIRSRFAVLRSNVRSWGDPRVGVVSRDPSAFGSEPLFDVIAADVPCSGEGMFRKEEKAVEDWSMDTVRLCTARSRRILTDIWPVLREGGLMLYSTCTFNHFENDDTVAWMASELGAEVLDFGPMDPAVHTAHGYLMLPGRVPGEGQYAAVLRKKGDGALTGSLATLRAEFPAESIPDYPRWELSLADALKYLHGDALSLPDAPLGLLILTYAGLPLGPAKNIARRCNNLYPKDRRIRMDI